MEIHSWFTEHDPTKKRDGGNYFLLSLQLKVVTGQLFLPELVAFKTMLWLKGFTLGFPGSNIQSFMISVQDLEKFPPLPDPKICKWLILV